MKLSYSDIEQIAENELTAFMGELVKSEKLVRAIPIENFAAYHLGLRVVHTRLSDNGQILGLTTYVDTNIELRRYRRVDKVRVLKDTVLLDESFRPAQAWQNRNFEGSRFTLAHECGHQIIYRMMPEDKREKLNMKYSARAFTPRQMKSLEDWSEWQASALASALLMPRKYIALMLNSRRLKFYGKRLNRPDKHIFDSMRMRFGVSESALKIRLAKLGYLQFLTSIEHSDPLDIIYSDEYEKLLTIEDAHYA